MLVVIYTRFSPRPNASDCDSCEKQLERCARYCVQKQYPNWQVFEDPATSGGLYERKGLQAAIALFAASKEKEKVFVVDSVNRVARDMLVSLTIRHEIERTGARVEYADGTPEETTAEGRLFVNILSAFAAYERERIRESIRRGLRRRQANGEWFGRPPVGYQLDPDDTKKLIANTDEQDDITTILNLAERGVNSEQIANFFSANGRLFRGRRWSPRTIRRVIADRKVVKEADGD